jgi:hypothetical protein
MGSSALRWRGPGAGPWPPEALVRESFFSRVGIRKRFLLEKKNQKTFDYQSALSAPHALTDKSFCFFFQKEVLSCA